MIQRHIAKSSLLFSSSQRASGSAIPSQLHNYHRESNDRLTAAHWQCLLEEEQPGANAVRPANQLHQVKPNSLLTDNTRGCTVARLFGIIQPTVHCRRLATATFSLLAINPRRPFDAPLWLGSYMTTYPFTPSEEEVELAERILVLQGLTEDGALKGQQARDVFDRSGLPPLVLRDVWSIADQNLSGDLTKDELMIAIRLIGWLQAGEELHQGLTARAGPLPTLDGITSVPPSWRKSRSVPNITVFPPVNEELVREAKRRFGDASPVNGSLSEGQVRDVYMNTSNLSYEDIREILKVVDRNTTRFFDFPEFACGMYLIQALQSSQLHSVPPTIPPDLFDQFKQFASQPTSPSVRPSLESSHLGHRSSSSLHLNSLQASPSTPSPKPSPLIPSVTTENSEQQQDDWGVPSHERHKEVYFNKLDEDQDGYIDKEDFGRFISIYKVPPAELDRVWDLTDFNADGRMSQDAFTVAYYLVKQRSSGDEIPFSLPPSLMPPSLRPQPASESPTISPRAPKPPGKKAAPPVPPKKRDSVSRHPSNMSIATPSIPASAGPSKYSTPLPSPMSTTILNHRSRPSISQNASRTVTLHDSEQTPAEVLSPFDDPENHAFAPPQPLASQSPPYQPSSPPVPIPDNSQQEALKEEISRLSRQVESLFGQLKAQNTIRDLNDTLRTENDILKREVKDTQQMMLEVLSANEATTVSKEDFEREIGQLMSELSNKESQCESKDRTLAVVTENERELRDSLRESQAATTKAVSEAADLKQTVDTQAEEIADLKVRLADMGKAMAEPNTPANNRELRVLIRDVTRENDSLKGQVRDMQRSMEQLLLSTKHAAYDEMGRDNRRLKEQVRDLEGMVTQLQSSVGLDPSSAGVNGHASGSRGKGRSSTTPSGSESSTRETELLKSQLRDGKRAFAEFRSSSEMKLGELQQKVEDLVKENNRLKVDVHAATSGSRREDNTVPPPAYDDTFVIPP